MYNKRYKKSNKKIYGMCTIIVLLIYTISICYSTLQQQLEINGLVKVRRQENIRVTGVEVESNTKATSNWEEYDVKNVSAGITLPNAESSITYKVKVTNFGNVDMGIYNIDGLDDKLKYEITDYELKDKIKSGGNKKEFKITIKYKDGKYDGNNTDYNILLNFDFRAYYKVTYKNFPNGTDSLPQEIMERDTLRVDFKDNLRYIKVYMGGLKLPTTSYKYTNNVLEIENVMNDVEVVYKWVTDTELVLRTNDEKDTLTDNLVGGMYRYQGTNDVNNYICFGTEEDCSQSEDLINKYMYRIIGITEDGSLKLIKESEIETTSIPTYDYKDSSIRKSLNGSTFLTNTNYMTAEWADGINTHKWLYGQAGEVRGTDLYNGNYMYEIESGQKEVTFNSKMVEYNKFETTTKAWDESVDDKVGMLYLHDYLYAYPGGNPETAEKARTSWIAPKNYELVITSAGKTLPNISTEKTYFLGNTGIRIDYDNYLAYNSSMCNNVKSSCLSSCQTCQYNCYTCLSSCGSHCNLPSEQGGLGRDDCDSYCATNCASTCNNCKTGEDCTSNCNSQYQCDQYKTYYRPVIYLNNKIVLNKGTGEKNNPYRINKSSMPKSTLTILKENDKNNNLTDNLVGDIYRYQGTDNVNNYICFGTTSNCGTDDTNIDKYMYRIIGITEDGSLKLIKENGINTTSIPASDYKDSGLRSELNGSKFLTNTNYMTTEWTYVIDTHTWLYGYAGSVYGTNLYNGDYMYEIESGNKVVTFNSSLLSLSPTPQFETTTKAWNESVDDKVGMLYLHDYLYAYPGGNPETKEKASTSWIAPLNQEYIITLSEVSTPGLGEQKIRMYKLSPTGIDNSYINDIPYSQYSCNSSYGSCMGSCQSNCYTSSTNIGECMNNCTNSCNSQYHCDYYKAYYRPVIYLNKDITLKEGTGSKNDPFILDV